MNTDTFTTVYRVYSTVDEYGRKGTLLGYFSDLTEAEKINSNAGWYGGKEVGVKQERPRDGVARFSSQAARGSLLK